MIPDHEKLLSAYSAFLAVREANTCGTGLAFPDFEKFRLMGAPNPEDNFIRFNFTNLAESFAREVVNELHGVRRYILDLRCWEKVIASFDGDDRILVIWEFLDERTVFALSRPAAIKARLVYAAVKLGQHCPNTTRDIRDFPDEHSIAEKHLKKWVGDWPHFVEFQKCLQAVDGKAFRGATSNFRNCDAHRFPRRIEIGLSPGPGVDVVDSRVVYSWGHHPALKLDEIERAMTEEYSRLVAAVDAFWQTVFGRAEVWYRAAPVGPLWTPS